jgi:hypothetical protein
MEGVSLAMGPQDLPAPEGGELKLKYVDQCSNQYKLFLVRERGDAKSDTFSYTLNYDPIDKMHSSSGEYNGGEPRSWSVGKTVGDAIMEKARVLLGDTGCHIGERRMGSSILRITGEGKVYIKYGGPTDVVDALSKAK